ncbi:hypothetical protein LEP1GSC071_3484 [Leptospira santarosai str. JET]|nr:hypothetical protein LEP1GSC071_3484 [Leptospira santarosai str. JET]
MWELPQKNSSIMDICKENAGKQKSLKVPKEFLGKNVGTPTI